MWEHGGTNYLVIETKYFIPLLPKFIIAHNPELLQSSVYTQPVSVRFSLILSSQVLSFVNCCYSVLISFYPFNLFGHLNLP